MAERNRLLRAARERQPSRRAPGEHLSRSELAEQVNAWLWEHTGRKRRFGLDDHLVAKWEQGSVRYPSGPYRSALRAILGVATDAELGFVPPARRLPSAPPDERAWTRAGILDDATMAVEIDVLNRRNAVRAAAIGGAGLLGPLAQWLEPLADGPLSGRSGAFAVAEVEAVEHLVVTFQQWGSAASGMGRTAVVGQLSDLSDRLRGAPSGPLTDRVFLVAAELASIAGWMAFDAGAQRIAQQHYGTAVRMAKAGGDSSFGAFALDSLAHQSFSLGATDDGLEIVHLAQRGTRDSATPAALRSLLAGREACGHAQRGNVHAFARAVDVAQQAHLDSEPDGEPRWLRGHDAAELAGVIGARYREMALHDRRHAHHAVEYIGRALALRDPSLARNRAMDFVSLGRTHLLTGEPELSAVTVRSALPLIDPHRPGRLGRKLADWHREAAPFAAIPEVRDTREQIRELVSG
jgi:hypothetical protein